MEIVLVGFGPVWRGVGLQHTRGLFGPSVNRWSIKRSPNDTKLDRRSTGSKPRPLGKSRSNPEMFNPHTRRKLEMTTGGERSTGMQNGQRGKCSDARDEHVCECNAHDDMIWDAWQRKQHTETKTRTRKNKYNLTPETARVGVQIGKVTSGVLQATLQPNNKESLVSPTHPIRW